MEMNDLILKHYEDICHYGIKGQKWGVRRYQNKDGTYTNTGKARRRGDELKSELDGVILKDIGFEDTPEARTYIRQIYEWD